MKLKLLKLLVVLLTTFTVNSQNFIEKQLPTPQNLSSFFIGPLLKSTIHYGAKPNNYNGEILVFNHGYIDLNQLFFTNNTFYQEAYNSGYQVVFVATTRGEGMWKNGELLAEAIDKVTLKYNVNDIYLIAHSNGGKAAEVAMFTHNKKDKIKRVFALGTPYWGTYLADLSQQWWFNWIWKQTGLNGGAATSTTYYCRDVVRPYFDNLVNNQPEKFHIIGGSGFASGHTILAPLMFTSGTILYLNQGTNDGVAPYNSTLRPGATYLFSKHEAKLDHVDVALGQYVWKYIAPLLNNNPNKTQKNKQDYQQPNKIVSDYQIINSENKYDNIRLDKGSSKALIKVYKPNTKTDFTLTSNSGILTPLTYKNKPNFNTNKFYHEYLLNINNNDVTQLISNSEHVAFVHQPKGVKMILKTLKKENKLTISFTKYIQVNDISIDIIISKNSDLFGKPVNGDIEIYSPKYNTVNRSFTLDLSLFDKGVYSIHITATHKHFKRSLVSGFTVGSLNTKNLKDENLSWEKSLNIILKSNIVKDFIEFKNLTHEDYYNTSVKLYNINGQLIQNNTLKNNKINVSNLDSGFYIAILYKSGKTKSFKLIKQ
ncbi:T9SS type A sorting domain-containing protein [Tenacibaculum sp. SDUM215027]|uniref:T9SS type A sorting domain-containing protein n=1 Tax=Tenacibaculum sp. SDUM215027 TaxID=3422596 RepID=UPI003D31D39E